MKVDKNKVDMLKICTVHNKVKEYKINAENMHKKMERKKKKKICALTGNRTRASRVAGENSTTEPSVRF